MAEWTRRAAIAAFAAPLAAAPRPCWAFGYSLKGLPAMPVQQALKFCRQLGFDAVEIIATKGAPTEASALSKSERRAIRETLIEQRLQLASLMEGLDAAVGDAQHRENMDRLRAAAELAHDLAPKNPPVIELILGGRPPDWAATRNQIVERLRDWAKVAEQSRITLAVKAHIGNALHTPEDAAWLIEQVASPRVRLNFDYSHFQLQGFALEDCLRKALRYAVFIHIKDSVGTREKYRFALPGKGTIPYPRYASLLREHGYRGPVVVEVSTHVLQEKDFDAEGSARFCMEKLGRVFQCAAG